MPTGVQIKEDNDWVREQGYSVDILYRPSPQVQWYRGDGTPLPNLLPCDPWHLRKFRAKGWTLKPHPVAVAAPVPAAAPSVATAPLYVSDKPKRPRLTTESRPRGRPKKNS